MLFRSGEALGCQVVEMSALKGEGGMEAAEKAVALARSPQRRELPHVFTGSVEHALAHIEESISGLVDERYLRWFAIKIFERDEKLLQELHLEPALQTHLEEHIADCEKELDDDAESIVTNQRYAYISKVIGHAVKKKSAKHSMTVSDKIDRIVTNRVLALPIFALVMFAVYYISIGTVGDWLTGWTNDVLFGDVIPPAVEGWLVSLGCAEWLVGLAVKALHFYDGSAGVVIRIVITNARPHAAVICRMVFNVKNLNFRLRPVYHKVILRIDLQIGRAHV